MVIRYTPDEDQAARTAWGEARSEGPLGMWWVLMTIRNRIDDPWVLSTSRLYHRPTAEEVVQLDGQYDCWRPDDPNRPKLARAEEIDPQGFAIACAQAVAALRPKTPPFPGITHYCRFDLVDKTSWTQPPAVHVELPGQGKHRFYRHVF